ncbi:HIT family protein [Candidatus Woesearchaeota archaeon]|nr:HIT family protein [Candidatus Woesearchaeota archaeon]
MVELSPEVKAQLEEQKKQCVFCKILNGEIAAKKVYEDKVMIGVLDINPAAKGHMLLLPKEHYPILPFMPPANFVHMFGLMPNLINALRNAMVCSGARVFIANGGAAGQQSSHFLVHMIPGDKGDGFNYFSFDKLGLVDDNKFKQFNQVMENNLPVMMRKHFQQMPNNWFKGKPGNADFLADIKMKQQVLYEDEKVLCVAHDNALTVGHYVVYSNEERSDIEKLDVESSAHMFYVASYCANAVFQGLGAHATNIIMKTGTCSDNAEGRLCIHVLPRYGNDGLDLLWKPMENKGNLDDIASRIRDQMFEVEHSQKEVRKVETLDLDAKELHKISDSKDVDVKTESAKDEIEEALKKYRGE